MSFLPGQLINTSFGNVELISVTFWSITHSLAAINGFIIV